ncbi:hypothetical protein F5148DRAFT_978611 [Russula earlei]|uniref:Uncharacterized protein n=1 Tax=Russula earlei TaxID=71964 RepID=A0ACC0UCM4_9AGAM|nr:hypothetical protein F5148DRAFT_978611 [Russula earlei]
MSGQTRTGSARFNAYHGTKRQLMGSAQQVPPAWRTSLGIGSTAATNGSTAHLSKKNLQRGSKILLSNLPMDVVETEVEELFKRTIGPVKDLFLIYNSQGRPKGMAIVTFHRPTDAGVARSKYDGKVIDGKHKLKIEVVADGVELPMRTIQERPNVPPSLLSRISGPHIQAASDQAPKRAVAMPPPYRTPFNGLCLHRTSPFRQLPAKRSTISIAVSGPQKRTKKGPKRVKKTLDQLDREMEEYRASAA